MNLGQKREKAKALQRNSQSILSRIRDSGAEFLLHRLAMGLTFAQLAHDSEKRGQADDANRQKATAENAHQTVLKSLPEARLTPELKSRIESDLAELEFKLKALGL